MSLGQYIYIVVLTCLIIVILSSLVPKIHSACLDKRLRTNQVHGL